MAKTKHQKHQLVKQLEEKLSRSNSVVFTDFQGMKTSQLLDLRNKLRPQQAELEVTKNSLLAIALKNTYNPADDQKVADGPTATLFSFADEITPIKILVKAIKETRVGKVKSGFVGKEYLDAVSISRLASLPSKNELKAKVVESLASPIYGIVGVLQASLRNVVYALDQRRIKISIKRGGELI